MRAGDVLILAYHNIVPEGEAVGGDRSLHLPRREFARQLDVLVRTHRVIRLSDVALEGATSDRPLAVVTFDDAYRGAVAAGLSELADRDLPSTMFVAPGRLGDRSFWWDALAGADGLDGAVRQRVLWEMEGSDERAREWAAAAGLSWREPPAFQRSAHEAELDAALSRGLTTLGSHSWSHANLAALPEDRLVDELERPAWWLQQRFGDRFIPWIAYPYGLTDHRVEAAARLAGYRAGLRVDGGWLGRSGPGLATPRFNVPAGLRLSGFRLRTSGLLS